MSAHETIVVGGGVIGLAIGYELARRGQRTLVLDRGQPAGAASLAAAGMLAPVSEADMAPEALLKLGLESLGLYPQWVQGIEERAGIDVGFRAGGTLWVAVHRDEAGELAHLEETLRRRGLAVERMTAGALWALEPRLSPRTLSGLSVAGDRQVDPRLLCIGLRAAIGRLAGAVRSGCEVSAVEVDGGALRVRGIEGSTPIDLTAANVVVAAGAWASQSLRLPLRGLALRPVRGQIVRLRGEPVLQRVLRTSDCYLVPRADGELLVGSTVEEQGFDVAPTAGAVHDLLRRAREIVPAIYDLTFEGVSVGLRPALADHLPAIGATEVPGLHLAVGHFRSGILLAPVTAKLIAERILDGREPADDAVSPRRLGLSAARPAA
jgi:glycine oxidase